MSDQKLESKVGQDMAKAKKDLSTLTGDNPVRLVRFEDKVSQAVSKTKSDLTTWLGDSTSQLSEGFEDLTGKAKETVVDAAMALKKDVGQELSQYNAKAQKVADKVPGDFGEKAVQYPWVAISIALAVGFLLGSLLKPTRQPIG